jgi:WD40 repeat protein
MLASNPKGTSVLDLDREIRDVREGLRRSQNRDEFRIEVRGAVRPIDLRRALLEVEPQIVHFCGHGTGDDGLVLEDDDGKEHLVSGETLSRLFELFADKIECVLLNACYSEAQAKAIVQHINYVIGMNREILDEAAIAFAVGFYDGIGAGKSIEMAYKLGCNAIEMELSSPSTQHREMIFIPSPDDLQKPRFSEHLIPVINKKEIITIIEQPPDNSKDLPSEIKQANTWNYITSFKGHSDWIRSLAFSPDGQAIVSGSNDKTVRLWNVQTGQLIYLLTGHKDRVKSVGISPDGNAIISGDASRIVKVWDWKTGQCQQTINTSFSPAVTLNSIAIRQYRTDSPGTIMATGSGGDEGGVKLGQVKLWELETGERQLSFKAHFSPVRSLVFSPNGKILASGSNSCNITLWRVEGDVEKSVSRVKTINNAHLSEVLSLAVSPDGQTLVSAGADRTIKLWDLATGAKKQPHILYGHAGRVWCVAISPDGTKIASASADYTVKVWNLATGKLLQTLTGHLGEVRAVAFNPDSNLIASGGDDLEIRLWQLQV